MIVRSSQIGHDCILLCPDNDELLRLDIEHKFSCLRVEDENGLDMIIGRGISGLE